MMRYLLLVCLLPVVLLASSSPPEESFNFNETGNDFLRVCDTKESNRTVMDGVCLGYVNGVLEGFNMAMRLGQAARHETITTGSLFCLPSESTMGQKYRVVVKYMNDHPEKTHNPTELLILDAITEAFPCKQEKAPDAAPAKK
jgi:hypothetical protein